MPIRVLFRVLLAASLMTVVLPFTASPASGEPPQVPPVGGQIEGRYIVGFRSSVDSPGALSNQLERTEGIRTVLRYRYALEGFSAALTPGQVVRLRQHPKVSFVVADREAHAVGAVELSPSDFAPTGVRRVEAATTAYVHEASSVNVAVLDTGIDLDHPDLNVSAGKNCIGSGPPDDDHGHGTHVAGSIAAENDGARVTGVAPGTRVFAVKVLSSSGSGSWSQIICGIDWATSTRTDADGTNDIAVANMSLGGTGSSPQSCGTTTDPLHRAICASTAAGVTYVVAAGNSSKSYDSSSGPFVPAVYPQVLTVTAVSDSDGRSGATGGAPTCRTGEVDDRYASFSNWAATPAGQAHTVAGPGVCILSDARGGGTTTMSGTSMASPHLAGVVALCIAEAGAPGPCSGMPPAQIIEKIRADAAAADPSYGFTGDPLRPVSGRYYGYLARVGIEPPPPPPPPPPDDTIPTVESVSPANGSTAVSPQTSVQATFSEAMNQQVTQGGFSLVRTSGGTPVAGTFSWSGTTMTFTPSAALAEASGYTAKVSTAARDVSGNPLAADEVWSFSTLGTATATPVGVTIETGTLRQGGATQLTTDDNRYYEVNSTTTGSRIAAWFGSFTGVANGLSDLKVTYKGENSKSCSQTVSVWNWESAGWIEVDSRTVGSKEVLVEVNPAGTLADYVSGSSGELRVRVGCAHPSSNLRIKGDLLKIAYARP